MHPRMHRSFSSWFRFHDWATISCVYGRISPWTTFELHKGFTNNLMDDRSLLAKYLIGGILIGLGLGVALDNLGVGIGLGVAIGFAFFNKRKRSE